MITRRTASCPAGTIHLFTITNNAGARVTLSSLGAGVISIEVPDRHGKMADVVVGYEDPADYLCDGPTCGKIPGRYSNRIGRGLFSLDGREYHLAINNGPNSLHGGPGGFQNRLWDVLDAENDTVRFTYTSADGEEGYPGHLTVTATYRWTDDSHLELKLHAVTDAPTVLNLTSHIYFNLGGHDSGCALSHLLQLNSSQWLDTDRYLLPTGRLMPVDGTPMDFRSPRTLEAAAALPYTFAALEYGKGYDNCWAIDGYEKGRLQVNAILTHPASGRRLTILSSHPGVQVYTGNWLTGSPKGKGGYEYSDYDAVAIECQDFPDAPNRPEFPSTRLDPGEEYDRTIIYRFD